MTDLNSTRDLLRNLPSLAGPLWPFVTEDAPDAPQTLFSTWLRDAIDAGIAEPHAMTLSSVDAAGHPDARVLILKDVDQSGWHFASVSDGPKGRQIAANPNVALTFYWQRFGRQVRIRGEAIALSAEASARDFAARSPVARAMAMVGRQSDTLGERSDIERALRSGINEDVTLSWTVYAVAPRSVEFWQGDADRRHVRLRYERQTDGWSKALLWP
ncbi:oxidase [Devosia epidermidihirudinis]|uniref:Oxidase n=1 Tax=Devosia epidermidihirudinis TaxID=1293439 RepID=A0A0F5QEF8_9HYPH|nr:pyridoxal 5'-phosphate synthase [Devosia epidermidihirudinis]KKC39345.1 oxidase [Devosia epidermidihirudinis]